MKVASAAAAIGLERVKFQEESMSEKSEDAAEMECVHCGADIAIPLSTHEGRRDHWLSDGESFACEVCGGVNRVCCDTETEPYFADCEDEHCAACGLAVA